MTYEGDIKKPSLKWLYYVEIDIRECVNVYGSSPCTASGGQCAYNWTNCEDPDNFDDTSGTNVRTWKFCSKKAEQVFLGTQVFSSLISVSELATEIDPKRSVTINTSMKFRFEDIPNPPPFHHDKGAGKYHADRTSTFWRLFVQRFKNYRYAKIRLYQGRPEYTLKSQFSLRRELLISNIEFDTDDTVIVTATDKGRKTKNIKIPNDVSSTNVLTEELSAVATSIPVTDGDEFKLMSGGYASYGKIIDDDNGDEYFKFTGISSDDLTGVTRGMFGTTAVLHAADCKVIQVAAFADDSDTGVDTDTGMNPIDILMFIYLGWIGMAAADFDTTAFENERDLWYASMKYRRILENPTEAEKLISQIRQLTQSDVWQNDAQKYTFRGLHPVSPHETLTEISLTTDVLKKTFSNDLQSEKQVSAVILRYKPNDIWGTKDHTDKDDFGENFVWVNQEVEDPNYLGEPVELEFFGDWIPWETEARAFCARYMRRYSPEAPAEVKMTLSRKNIETETGDIIDLASDRFVNDDGSDRTVNFQVLARAEGSEIGKIELKCLETKFAKKYGWIAHSGYPDWTSATALQKAHAYICDGLTLKMSDGSGATYIF